MRHHIQITVLLALVAAAPATRPTAEPASYPALQRKLSDLTAQVAELRAANKRLADDNARLVTQVKALASTAAPIEPAANVPPTPQAQTEPANDPNRDRIPDSIPPAPFGKAGATQMAEVVIHVFDTGGGGVALISKCDELKFSVSVFEKNVTDAANAAGKKLEAALPGDGPTQNRMALAGWELVSTQHEDGDPSTLMKSWTDHFIFRRPLRQN